MTAFLAPLALWALLAPAPRMASVCPTQSAPADTSVATQVFVETLGDDFGQTFVARDSFLTRVVLWQPAQQRSSPVPVTLLIYDADSLGTPFLHAPILTGPTVVQPVGDTPDKSPLVFDLNPAIRLPHLGHFEVAFLVPCGVYLPFLYTLTEILPDGHMVWNRVSRCPWWSQSNSYTTVDVLVSLELCDHDPNGVSAALPMTWGRVKSIYRGAH
jgi:hypothetical protein